MYLEVKNVTKFFKEKKVLEDVSFSLKKSELICLVGPSGCGKTTILNIIGGFIDDYAGDVCLLGESIKKVSPENRQIATVFQNYGLFVHKNVFENIEYGLKFRDVSKEKRKKLVLDMLDKVGLKGYEKKKITNLSGGESQRVALARALILKPHILLLDEPFSNLDANLRSVMRKEIRKLQKEFNVTMIVVTHDKEDAFEIADKIVLLNKGKIEQIATPRDIYYKPKNDFVANFIGENNSFKGENIRREQIKLTKNKSGSGIILEKKFKGEFIEYVIEYENEKIKALTLSSEEEFSLDDRVEIEVLRK